MVSSPRDRPYSWFGIAFALVSLLIVVVGTIAAGAPLQWWAAFLLLHAGLLGFCGRRVLNNDSGQQGRGRPA